MAKKKKIHTGLKRLAHVRKSIFTLNFEELPSVSKVVVSVGMLLF